MARNPEGYSVAHLARPEIRKALRHAGGAWRPAIHGVYVFAAEDGYPLATVRTLGMLLPKRQRRYSLKILGVTFERILPVISETRPIKSDICAYETAKAALQAGSALIERLRTEVG
jgi:hypothetical protein